MPQDGSCKSVNCSRNIPSAPGMGIRKSYGALVFAEGSKTPFSQWDHYMTTHERATMLEFLLIIQSMMIVVIRASNVHNQLVQVALLYGGPVAFYLTPFSPMINVSGLILFLVCVLYRTCVMRDQQTVQVCVADVAETICRNFRFVLLCLTVVAIQAIDTGYMSTRFLKSDIYGFGYLDLGIGMFNMLIGCERAVGKVQAPSSWLMVFGAVRFMLLHATNYSYNPGEFGKHCNSFFLIYVSSLFSYFTFRLSKMSSVILFALSFVFQYFELCLADALIPYENLFPELIKANWHALLSINGLMCLQYAGQSVLAAFMRMSHFGRTLPDRVLILVSIASSIVSLSAWMIWHKALGFPMASRALCNNSYILLIIAYWCACLPFMCMYFAIIMQGKNVAYSTLPRRYSAIQFVIGNLLTGLLNLIFNMRPYSRLTCSVILLLSGTCCHFITITISRIVHYHGSAHSTPNNQLPM